MLPPKPPNLPRQPLPAPRAEKFEKFEVILANTRKDSEGRDGYFQAIDIITIADDAEYSKYVAELKACVCPPMYERLQAFDDFLDCWFLAVINAYLMRKLTFEQDRDKAVTQVARAVA